MEDGEICMSKVRFSLVQNGNTNGSSFDVEDLEVSIESPDLIDDSGHFFVIKSTSGWSIDSPEDIKRVIEVVSESVTALYKALNTKEGP